jgi:hypothetical protein
MDKDNSFKWVKEKLIPNFPGIIFINIAIVCCHNVEEDKVPTETSRKKDMVN